MPKERSPDDVHDLYYVEVGKPYRGQLVTNIEIEDPIDLPNERAKVRRLIHLDNGIIVIEDTVFDRGEIYDGAGNMLQLAEIKFPHMNPADLAGDDDEEDEEAKKKKQDELRKKAKELLSKRRPSLVKDDDDDDADKPKRPSATRISLSIGMTVNIQVHTPDGKKGKKIPMNLTPNDTIFNLRNKLQKDYGTPNKDQFLKYKGDILDEPRKTLQDLGVSNGDVIDLMPAQIKVKTPDGKVLSVSVNPSKDTVPDLKQRIADQHGIPEKEQDLTFKGKPLMDDSNKPLKDYGISHGDMVNMAAPPSKKKEQPKKSTGTDGPKDERVKMLGPNSVWVYPNAKCAPKHGEPKNLQGVWAVEDPEGTEPVEVNIHPKDKEPNGDKKTVHGAYGYINGAKPDANGVVDPANIIFYPPGAEPKDFRPDFEQVGWWSSPHSHSETHVSWRFKGFDCYYTKKQTVTFMGHTVTFHSEWKE